MVQWEPRNVNSAPRCCTITGIWQVAARKWCTLMTNSMWHLVGCHSEFHTRKLRLIVRPTSNKMLITCSDIACNCDWQLNNLKVFSAAYTGAMLTLLTSLRRCSVIVAFGIFFDLASSMARASWVLMWGSVLPPPSVDKLTWKIVTSTKEHYYYY